ncbi:hypothetical protein BBU94A_N03 (plasmid) [Borreliella burgdorferi 94a]|nr:hypothetical protein BBU72A_J0003 [Borreliella burgdorferi 72a]EEG99408.1 hypothetical protein BBU94A_N03 [Borreliella burgdorferi 94a]
MYKKGLDSKLIKNSSKFFHHNFQINYFLIHDHYFHVF